MELFWSHGNGFVENIFNAFSVKVTHVIVANSEVKKHNKKLLEANKMKIPTVNEDYLKQIIKVDLGGNGDDTDIKEFEVVSSEKIQYAYTSATERINPECTCTDSIFFRSLKQKVLSIPP